MDAVYRWLAFSEEAARIATAVMSALSSQLCHGAKLPILHVSFLSKAHPQRGDLNIRIHKRRLIRTKPDTALTGNLAGARDLSNPGIATV